MRPRTFRRVAIYGILGVTAIGLYSVRRTIWRRAIVGTAEASRGHVPTVDGALSAYGKKSDNRFRAVCKRAGVQYPPRRVMLVAFKEEKQLEVWGANRSSAYKRLAVYPILAASGVAGPKRKEGDYQVPEGFYRISALNPASQFHLSLRVDYPNTEDIAHRTVQQHKMGGDIYVHGGAASIGCIALGDPAIEEIFCLIARAGSGERQIIIAPQDIRAKNRLPATSDAWVADLYRRIQGRLRQDFAV
jgi:murein L,D-transpeptidase YafK